MHTLTDPRRYVVHPDVGGFGRTLLAVKFPAPFAGLKPLGLALSLASTARADCAAGLTNGSSAGISGSVASDSSLASGAQVDALLSD